MDKSGIEFKTGEKVVIGPAHVYTMMARGDAYIVGIAGVDAPLFRSAKICAVQCRKVGVVERDAIVCVYKMQVSYPGIANILELNRVVTKPFEVPPCIALQQIPWSGPQSLPRSRLG